MAVERRSADPRIVAFLSVFRMYTMDKPSMLGPPGSVLVSSKLSMQQLHQRAANIPPMVSHHGNPPLPPQMQ